MSSYATSLKKNLQKHKCQSISLFYLHKKPNPSPVITAHRRPYLAYTTSSGSHIQVELIIQSVNSFWSLYCSLKRKQKSVYKNSLAPPAGRSRHPRRLQSGMYSTTISHQKTFDFGDLWVEFFAPAFFAIVHLEDLSAFLPSLYQVSR